MRKLGLCFFLMSSLLTAGCGPNDMRDQPKYKPLEKSDFYPDGRSSRPLIEGTVARGQLHQDTHLETGKVNGQYVTSFPFEIDEKVLTRGKERYEIFCSLCHDAAGTGKGMVVRRGFPVPPSFHDERLRTASPGYLFNVITNGLGNMPPYESQVPVYDRWAIIAYLRVLQQSQNTTWDDLTPASQQQLLEPHS